MVFFKKDDVCLWYAVSILDFQFSAYRCPSSRLVGVQCATDAALLAALRAPRTAPRCLLYVPLQSGGFGGPHLCRRFELRFVGAMLAAMNSRNALARGTLRHLVTSPGHLAVAGNDVSEFLDLLAGCNLAMSLPPHRLARPVTRTDSLVAPYQGGPALVMSDGSVAGDGLGWGAVVATPAGIIGSTRGGLLAAQPSSWVAEWIGKLEALLLADRLGVPQAALHWSIADNLSACLGAMGGRPSQSPWIDELQILFAECVAATVGQEFIPTRPNGSVWLPICKPIVTG